MSHYESGQLITLAMDRADIISEMYAPYGVEVFEVSVIDGECTLSAILLGRVQYIDSIIEVTI